MTKEKYKQLVESTRRNQKLYPSPIPAVIGLIHKGTKVLVVKNDKKLKHWQLVAGFINPGESAEQAMVREVKEETNLVVKPRKILGTFPYQKGSMQLIIAIDLIYISGLLTAQDDIIEAKWVEKKERVRLKKGSLSEFLFKKYK